MSDQSNAPSSAAKKPQSDDPTVKIAEPIRARATAGDVVITTSSSSASQSEAHDSRLIRIHDGHLVPVIEPHSGVMPEERYRHPTSGQGELGKGAIGQVHLVFDAVLGREVAMKELRDEYSSKDDAFDNDQTHEATWRFLREARVTGQLEHPNIVPVYELGCRADGTIYYTMRVVRGRTLGEALSKATSLKERLGLLHHFADICQAIAYAHSRGVLHRDIKPNNVMIGEFGETFVLDWGLARVATRTDAANPGAILSLPPAPLGAGHAMRKSVQYDDHEHTSMGDIVGTPQYMSPEQIIGVPEGQDARSDVWSLGVVLYIILTGRTPFSGRTMAEILTRVLTGVVPEPSTIEPGVPLELQAITLRALKRDKEARYANAGEMAKDVTAYQSGARVEAYAYGSAELIRRFVARHRAAAVVTGIACLAIMSLAATSYLRIARERDKALLAEHRATAGQQLANSRYADALVEKARSASLVDDVVEAELLAAEAATTGDSPEARGILVSLANATRLVPNSTPATLAPCTQIIPTPKSDKFLCLALHRLSAFRGSIHKWSIDVPEALSATSVGTNETAVLTKKNRWLVYSDTDGQLVAEGEVPLTGSTAVAGAEQQSWLASADSSGNVAVWNVNTIHPSPYILRWSQAVTALAFAHNRPSVVLGGKFGRLAVWDYAAHAPAKLIGESHASIESIVTGPKDALVITGGSDGSVSLWDLAKGQFLGNALRRQVGISSLALSDQGRWLIAGTRTAEVDLIDLQGRARVFSIPPGAGPFRPLAFDQRGQPWLLRGSTDVVGFSVVEPSPRSRLLDRGNVLSMSWMKGSEFLFSGGLHDSGVCLFRVADGACLDRLPVRLSQVRVVAVSPNGRHLVLAGTGNVVQVWDATNRLPTAVGQVPIEQVRALAFDASGDNIYLGGVASIVLKFDLTSGKVVEQWNVDGQVQSMAMTRDFQSLVLGLRDGRIQWRHVRGTLVHEARHHQGWVSGIEVSPSLDFGVSVGADGKTQFWRAGSLELMDTHQDHVGRATAIALSPDGKYIATAGEDQTLVVSKGRRPWDRLARLQEQRGTIRCVAFDQSSQWLASGGDDASIRLWNLQALDADPRAIQASANSTWGLRLEGARVLPQ